MPMFQLYHPYFNSQLPKTLSEQHVKEKNQNNFLNTVLAVEYSALCKEYKSVSEYMGCTFSTLSTSDWSISSWTDVFIPI